MPQKSSISFSVCELQKTIMWGRKMEKQQVHYPPTSKLHRLQPLAIWSLENIYTYCDNY